jgi:hypothetical protein
MAVNPSYGKIGINRVESFITLCYKMISITLILRKSCQLRK